MAKQKINKSKNTALESHKKSDKAKWAITFISLILIATLLGGLCYVVIEKIDVKKEVTNNVSGVISNGTYSNGVVAGNVINNSEGVFEFKDNINNISFTKKEYRNILWYGDSSFYDLYKSSPYQSEESFYINIKRSSSQSILFSPFYIAFNCPRSNPVLIYIGERFQIYEIIGSITDELSSDSFVKKVDEDTPSLYRALNTLISQGNDINVKFNIDFVDEANCIIFINDINLKEYLTSSDSLLYINGYLKYCDEILVVDKDFFEKDKLDYSKVNNYSTFEVVEHYIQKVDISATIPLPEPPTKEGYTFTGWFLDEDCTIPYEGTTITEDTVLYAGWKINTYTVTFDSDGGSSVSNQTVDWNTSAQLTTPTKTGHTFVGWFLPSGEQYTNQPIKSATTLKAKWKANTYTVTFNSDGGSAVENKTVEYGKSVTLTSPTKTGFDFVGWFLPSGDKYTNQAITDNVTLTARWTIKKLSVSFNTDGGTSISDKQVEYGKPVELPTTEKQGYNFKGWFLPSGEQYTNQAITENVTLTAKWEIKTFKVTFIVDGEVYREMTVDYGTTLVDVANKAEVSSKNILSYKYVDESIPTTDLGSMKVVGDIEVKANAPTESDITISKIKNNTFAIIGGVLGGLVLIMVVCGVVTAIKRR